jgi:DNA adenine methylase
MGSSSAALIQVPGGGSSEPVRPRPFLKWAGGKGRSIAQLRPHLPAPFKRYFEPFAGGAALFFALTPAHASLTDVNSELIDCYRMVRDRVEDAIVALRRHRYAPEHYYRVRAMDPSTLKLPERAARTIYLNKTGYNGLYRVNRAGKFNVPMGRYTNPTVCDADNLRACSAALQRVELKQRDFAEQASRAKAGDFVYFDPPYDPMSATSAFTSYAPGGFGHEAQRRLAELFARLARKGVHVVLSNSDTPLVRELYRPFRIAPILAARSINSRGSRRGKVGEVVVTSFG